MNKEVNIYSFNDECYVYLGDYNNLERENEILKEENKRLKEEFLKLEDKYIHNVPCCNEEDCEFYKKYKENETDLTTIYLKGYEDGKEKYNHYKLLYQKVKDRNDKAIEYLHETCNIGLGELSVYGDDINPCELKKILEGNNE